MRADPGFPSDDGLREGQVALGAVEERLLMVPGPTNLSKRVREALSQPQVGHTDPDFVKNFSETLQLARKAFRNNKRHQFVFTGTGTVGMEAAVASTVEPGDKVLVLNTGYFGQRMVDINRCYGADVEELGSGFGLHADPDAVRKRLAAGRFKALYVTHVDTGTTVCNPVADIVKEAKKRRRHGDSRRGVLRRRNRT